MMKFTCRRGIRSGWPSCTLRFRTSFIGAVVLARWWRVIVSHAVRLGGVGTRVAISGCVVDGVYFE